VGTQGKEKGDWLVCHGLSKDKNTGGTIHLTYYFTAKKCGGNSL